jgi:hypothetical protein
VSLTPPARTPGRLTRAGTPLLDLHPDDNFLTGTVPAPPSVPAPIGVNADSEQVSLFDLPGAGVALTGAGALPAARAIIAAALSTGTVEYFAARPVVVTTADTLARLLPTGVEPAGLDPGGDVVVRPREGGQSGAAACHRSRIGSLSRWRPCLTMVVVATMLRHIIEETLDIDLARLRDKPVTLRPLIERAIARDLVTDLGHRVKQYHAAHPLPAIARSELVPQIYQQHEPTGILIGPKPPLNAPSTDKVKRTLLFAHRLVVRDPFYGIEGPPGGFPYKRFLVPAALGNGLRFWTTFHDLIDEGVIMLTPPPPESGPTDLGNMFEALAGGRRFRAEVLVLFPHLPDLVRIVRPCPRPPDLVGPPGDTPSRNGVRAKALATAYHSDVLNDGDLSSAVHNLERWIGLTDHFSGDAWFPNMRHLKLALALARNGGEIPIMKLTEAELLTRIIEFDVPSVAHLDNGDVVRLRRESEVFETWRTDLSMALAHMDDMVAAGLDDQAARRELREQLMAVADRTAASVRDTSRADYSGSLRSMAFGVLGATVGGALDGVRGAAVGAAGAFAEATAELVKGRLEQRSRTKTQQARMRHALALSEMPQPR